MLDVPSLYLYSHWPNFTLTAQTLLSLAKTLHALADGAISILPPEWPATDLAGSIQRLCKVTQHRSLPIKSGTKRFKQDTSTQLRRDCLTLENPN